jgi:ribonuclease HII
MSSIIGIDEAGRGPLAGPVAVGAVMIPSNFDEKFFEGLKDSKKLSEAKRELWFKLVSEAKKKGELDYVVALVSEKVIDEHGISYALKLGIKGCLDKLKASPDSSRIFLDGSLKAPDEFKNQETIIKGDEKIPVISLASIMAKVTRDRKMTNLSTEFPEYSFAVHKGYGTKVHMEAISKYGLTKIHRRSFLKKLV